MEGCWCFGNPAQPEPASRLGTWRLSCTLDQKLVVLRTCTPESLLAADALISGPPCAPWSLQGERR
eukprot:5360422-Prorocentrum_lima.AAC.1